MAERADEGGQATQLFSVVEAAINLHSGGRKTLRAISNGSEVDAAEKIFTRMGYTHSTITYN